MDMTLCWLEYLAHFGNGAEQYERTGQIIWIVDYLKFKRVIA